MKYKLIKDFSGQDNVIFDTETNTSFRLDGNSTYLQEYIKWLENPNNKPLPADE